MDVNTHEESATGRLFLVMNHMHGLRASPNVSLQQAFADFHGLDVNNLVELLPLVAAAVGLPDAAEHEVASRRLPVAPGRFQTALDQSRTALVWTTQLAGITVGNVISTVAEASVVALESASEALWLARSDPGATPEMLRAVRDSVNALIEAVTSDPDLNDEARLLLLKHATALHAAVAHYRAFGFGGLQEWEERFLGAMYTHPAAKDATENRPGIMARIVAVFVTVNTIATAVHASYVLGTDVTSLLPIASPPKPHA